MSRSLEFVSSSSIVELQRALTRSEARYDELVRRAGYGIYRSTPDGRFIEANSVLATLLGYGTIAELLRLDLAKDVYLDPGERDRLKERLAGPAFPDRVEPRWKRRDGTPITVRLSVRAVLDAAGEVEFYDGLVEDVTERQRHDELLRRNERMATLGATLAGVAHELNNPLAAIIGFSQLLLKKQWSADDRAALETISHEAIRSATIVKDLLALARKRDGERRVSTNINDVIGYVARTRRYSMETGGIGCTLELDPSLSTVSGDRAQLEQVVLNLLNNAEQALRPGVDGGRRATPAQVVIRTRRDQPDVVIEVEDNGPGIPESARAHIWDPFWTTKEEGEGTGLGLSVVHGIVTDHGGTISLECPSNGGNEGARFVIRLPASAEAMLPETMEQAIRPLDVLIVDPGASDLLFVERFLTSRGHAVINAGSGELAVRLAAQTTFDAVVCDARLQSRDGTTIASALRTTPGCEFARFVLSEAATDAPERTATANNAAIVSRPYDVEKLRRLIEGD